MKTLDRFEIWQGKETAPERGKLKRISRWITVKHNYNPGKNNCLWDYVTDENGYHSYQDSFNPENGLYLDYFIHNGKSYAIEQFIAFGSIADSIGHFYGYIENSERHFLSGYDSENYYRPVLIEIDPWGEKVRLYEEV